MSNNPVTQLVSICGIAVGSFYSMNVYEPLCWMGCAYLLVRATSVFDTACPRQSVATRITTFGDRASTPACCCLIDSTRGDEREQFEPVEDLGVVDSSLGQCRGNTPAHLPLPQPEDAAARFLAAGKGVAVTTHRRHSAQLTRAVLLLASLFSIASCASPDRSLYPAQIGQSAHTVFVVNHGLLHTGIAIERREIPAGMWPAQQDYAGSRYLEVGWGEDNGYRKHLTPAIALHALHGSERTVLLCEEVNDLARPKVTTLAVDLSDEGFARLCRHIAETYALDAHGRPILLERNWYRARGRYSAFHNCNTWIAAGLRKAGCPLNPTICITPRPLMFQVRQFGRAVPRKEPVDVDQRTSRSSGALSTAR